jgi:hypothetical protein
MTYTVSPCPCGHRACRNWHVSWVASVQGVRFTEAQARAVAALLNKMEKEEPSAFDS